MKLAVVLIAALWACTGTSTTKPEPRPPATGDQSTGSGSMGSMKMTPTDRGGTFVRGPGVTPGDDLIAWLDQQQLDGKPRLIRIPVVLAKGDVGWSTRGARIGDAAGAVEIYCDDSTLGIGLADQARSQCKDAAVCALWLDGYWRGNQDGDLTFEVRKVHAPIAAADLAAASYVEVEGESGN